MIHNMKDFNEKCAEYLGWRLEKTWEKNLWWYEEDFAYNKTELKFDSDWNWIMIVLEAILDECSEDYHFEPFNLITDDIPNLEKLKKKIYNYITNDEII